MPDTLPRDRRGNRREDESRGYNPETDAEEDEWDRQIEEDAKAGKLDKLAERARAQYRAGNATDLEGNPVCPDEEGAEG